MPLLAPKASLCTPDFAPTRTPATAHFFWNYICFFFSTVLMAESAIKMQKYKVYLSLYSTYLGFITLFTGRCCCRYISSNTQTKDGQRKIAAQLAIVMTSSHLFTKRSITPVLYTVTPYFGTSYIFEHSNKEKKVYSWIILRVVFSTFCWQKVFDF